MTRTLKVLIVDDHPYELKKFKEFVESLGHEVVTANGGREATNILMPIDSLPPSIDAIITDTRMGEHGGIYVLQFVNRNNNPPPTLLHSSETTCRYHDYDYDLPTVIPDAFRFAQFHLKDQDLTYIEEFLAKIA
jgi:CheY-like chemotaxis protein